jgi:hypothetical protein
VRIDADDHAQTASSRLAVAHDDQAEIGGIGGIRPSPATMASMAMSCGWMMYWRIGHLLVEAVVTVSQSRRWRS